MARKYTLKDLIDGVEENTRKRNAEDIKSIVTKEQFESMEYKL